MDMDRFLTDDALLAQCREDLYRGSGPGGQKRNKTSNAVRLVHRSTGLIVTATEARSLLENRTRALRRMRVKLASEVREPIDAGEFTPPEWFLSIRRERRIEASPRHPLHTSSAGLILDLLQASGGNPSMVAASLGTSTAAVLKVLESRPEFWRAANAIRAQLGMKALMPKKSGDRKTR